MSPYILLLLLLVAIAVSARSTKPTEELLLKVSPESKDNSSCLMSPTAPTSLKDDEEYYTVEFSDEDEHLKTQNKSNKNHRPRTKTTSTDKKRESSLIYPKSFKDDENRFCPYSQGQTHPNVHIIPIQQAACCPSGMPMPPPSYDYFRSKTPLMSHPSKISSFSNMPRSQPQVSPQQPSAQTTPTPASTSSAAIPRTQSSNLSISVPHLPSSPTRLPEPTTLQPSSPTTLPPSTPSVLQSSSISRPAASGATASSSASSKPEKPPTGNTSHSSNINSSSTTNGIQSNISTTNPNITSGAINSSVNKTGSANSTSGASGNTSTSAVASTNSNGSSSSGETSVSEQEFNLAVTSCGYPQPSSDKYKSFIQGISKSGISSKRELAMFLANILHESDGLKAKEEIQCLSGGCKGQYDAAPDGTVYYGRGYIQLTWKANYAAASKDLYGDENKLLSNPGIVATDENAAWDTAFWYWKTRVHTAPGVTEGKFGATIKAINGALECGGGDNSKPKFRFEKYTKILKAFGINETPIESGCYN